MENHKSFENPEIKKEPPENTIAKFWEGIEKCAEEVHKLTGEEKIEKWWNNLFTSELENNNAERSSKVDDNGKFYIVDSKLLPNTIYELNGNIYITDEQGRIIRCEAKPQRSPENPRDLEAQKEVGGKDRRPNDQGGHIVGRDLNGDGGAGNLVAMDSKINQSDYKRMENDIKRALDDGKEVTTNTDISYSDTSERPDRIVATVTIDGKDTVYTYDNNLDGSLMEKVAEIGSQADVETVQSVINETGGQISSIKETYDINGNRENAMVTVTYVGDNDKNYRTTVVIENSNGGNK